MRVAILLSSLAVMCVACGIGTNSSTIPSISIATNNACGTGITTNSCTLTITYSTGGNSGLAFGGPICSSVVGTSSSTTCAISTYTFNFNNCSIVSSTNQQTCTVPVTYNGSGTPPSISENVQFTLSTATSNTISLGTGSN